MSHPTPRRSNARPVRARTVTPALQALEPRTLLSGAGDTAGDTLATATDLGYAPYNNVGAPVTGEVGAADPSDVFKIRTGLDGKLFVRGTYTYAPGATTGVGLQIIKDANNNRVIDPGETLADLSPAGLPVDHAIQLPAASGTYYVRFTGTDAAPHAYALTFSVTQLYNVGGRKIAYALDLGRLSSEFGAEALLRPDTSDWYTFRIGRDSDLAAFVTSDQSVTPLVFRDADGDREIDPGETLTGWTRTTSGGHKQDQLGAPLKPGTYYARLSTPPGIADSAYLLSLHAPPRLGQLEAGMPLTVDASFSQIDGNSIGGANPADFWRFSLPTAKRVSMLGIWSRDYDNPGFDPVVDWIRDTNANGQLDPGEVFAQTARGFDVQATLPAGTWYARVSLPPARSASSLSYQIAVHTLPDIATPATYRTATLFDATTVSEGDAPMAGTSYQGDLPAGASRYHAFTLDRRTGVRALLGYMTANANLELLKDVDGNGKFSDADVLISSARGGVKAERINAVLDPGTYLFRVASAGAATSYQLALTAIRTPADQPGATLPTAHPVFLGGNPAAPPFMDQISGGDRRDYYKINFNFTTFIRASVESLTGDVDISLVRDTDNDGIVDPGEVLTSSSLRGEGLTDALRYKFAPGAPTDNLYLRVYRASATPATYQLNFG